MTIDDQIVAARTDGYEIVQQGRVLRRAELGLAFSERVEGFKSTLLGTYTAPEYRSAYDNLIYDDDERWVHLRRDRRD